MNMKSGTGRFRIQRNDNTKSYFTYIGFKTFFQGLKRKFPLLSLPDSVFRCIIKTE